MNKIKDIKSIKLTKKDINYIIKVLKKETSYDSDIDFIDFNAIPINKEITKYNIPEDLIRLSTLKKFYKLEELDTINNIEKFVNNSVRKIIRFTKVPIGRHNTILKGILEVGISTVNHNNRYYDFYIPTIEECDELINCLGEMILKEPDLPYQYYTVRKQLYQIKNRLKKVENE